MLKSFVCVLRKEQQKKWKKHKQQPQKKFNQSFHLAQLPVLFFLSAIEMFGHDINSELKTKSLGMSHTRSHVPAFQLSTRVSSTHTQTWFISELISAIWENIYAYTLQWLQIQRNWQIKWWNDTHFNQNIFVCGQICLLLMNADWHQNIKLIKRNIAHVHRLMSSNFTYSWIKIKATANYYVAADQKIDYITILYFLPIESVILGYFSGN